jgi:hypothetical protein
MNYLLELVLNHGPPDLSLPSTRITGVKYHLSVVNLKSKSLNESGAYTRNPVLAVPT